MSVATDVARGCALLERIDPGRPDLEVISDALFCFGCTMLAMQEAGQASQAERLGKAVARIVIHRDLSAETIEAIRLAGLGSDQ